jgi:hypothetical protein
MQHFIFSNNYYNQISNDIFVGILDTNINTKEELIKDYWKKFKCPHGSINWDSLDEIISDFLG